MNEITNKSMFDIESVRATDENVGEWSGNEAVAADNFNLIIDGLYDAAPDEYNDLQMHQIIKAAWDDWGSLDELLTASKNKIHEYVKSVMDE